ncbi:hypothetical protein QVD17_14466 [Tagetes erecta]|uniref:E3 ubiquitin-protein ligase RMA n=1 Tax=Tagetes erecta TaxID=13708 RepID=A0AAD8L1S0_TARER|nr:hypothetical protein QVD17_14466 [Tagetes erecta]
MDKEVEFQESMSHLSCLDNIKCGAIGVFECNICFDLARDPIVTLCGHLFCWPCLYKWLHFHSYCHECPVCKSLIDDNKNLVPIYGRGTSSSDLRANSLSRDEIPGRPAGQRPRTAPPPDPSYFQHDGSGVPDRFMPMATSRLGGLTRTALVGALSSVLNLRVRDVRGTSGVDNVLSSYDHHGGFAHHYPIHVRGTKMILLTLCVLFFGVVSVLLLIALLLFKYY